MLELLFQLFQYELSTRSHTQQFRTDFTYPSMHLHPNLGNRDRYNCRYIRQTLIIWKHQFSKLTRSMNTKGPRHQVVRSKRSIQPCPKFPTHTAYSVLCDVHRNGVRKRQGDRNDDIEIYDLVGYLVRTKVKMKHSTITIFFVAKISCKLFNL